jgi:hypothetical protein
MNASEQNSVFILFVSKNFLNSLVFSKTEPVANSGPKGGTDVLLAMLTLSKDRLSHC